MNASKVAEKRLVAKVLSLQELAVTGHQKFQVSICRETFVGKNGVPYNYMVTFAEACFGYYYTIDIIVYKLSKHTSVQDLAVSLTFVLRRCCTIHSMLMLLLPPDPFGLLDHGMLPRDPP